MLAVTTTARTLAQEITTYDLSRGSGGDSGANNPPAAGSLGFWRLPQETTTITSTLGKKAISGYKRKDTIERLPSAPLVLGLS